MAVGIEVPMLSEDRYHSELRKLLIPEVQAGHKPDYKIILGEVVEGAKSDDPSPFTLDELLAVAGRQILADLRYQYRHLKSTKSSKPTTTTATESDDDEDEEQGEQTTVRCVVCNRRLTAEASVEAGIGPVCAEGEGHNAAQTPTDFGPTKASGIPDGSPSILYLNVHVASGEKKVGLCTLAELKNEVLPHFIRVRDDAQASVTGIQKIIDVMEANGADRAVDVVDIVKDAL